MAKKAQDEASHAMTPLGLFPLRNSSPSDQTEELHGTHGALKTKTLDHIYKVSHGRSSATVKSITAVARTVCSGVKWLEHKFLLHHVLAV